MIHRGFSLVELSIVLVILGLLTGGILAGQSLIKAAELRSVSAEYQRYTAAVHSFRDQYMALPGDMTNAASFWNRQVNQPWCAPTSGATVASPGACNGNGNGSLAYDAPAAAQSAEMFQFWRHLALAGLIEGNYTGLAGSAGATEIIGQVNVPSSKGGANALWSVRAASGSGMGMFSNWPGTGNTMHLGAATASNLDGDSAAFRPEEAWNIDIKLDDGRPAYGRIVTYSFTVRSNCSTSDDPAVSTYAVLLNVIGCHLIFVM